MNKQHINYLEHDIKVKLAESIIEHPQEWDWFVTEIEENYDLNDINSWEEFIERYSRIAELYSSFINIFKFYDGNIDSHKKKLFEAYEKSKRSLDEVIDFMKGKADI